MHSIFLLSAFLIFVYMTLLFICSRINKRNDIADIGWGIGFCIVALFAHRYGMLTLGVGNIRSCVVIILVLIWGIRLAVHIYARNRHKTEDPRYAKWREEWGKWFFIRSYLQVFLLQGLLLLLISTPVMLTATHNGHVFPTVLDIVGITVWIIGFLFESVGDKELALFLKNPENKGKLMDRGLWSITRHPNYFGEVSMWWGIWLLSLSAGVPWWSIVGPLTITILITKVSGIPMTEARYKCDVAYEAYKERVSALIPLYPGKKLFGRWKNIKK